MQPSTTRSPEEPSGEAQSCLLHEIIEQVPNDPEVAESQSASFDATPTDASAKQGLEVIAGMIGSTIERFLESFRTTTPMAPSSFTQEFFVHFLFTADAFANDCSAECAKLICRASVRSDLRAGKESLVARLVRSRCFEYLDAALIDYVKALDHLGYRPQALLPKLTGPRIRELLKEGGPESSTGRVEGVGKRAAPQLLKTAALMQIAEYLQRLRSLLPQLLDYGAAKLFSGELDLVEHRKSLQTVHEKVLKQIEEARAFVEGIGLVRQKRLEEVQASDNSAMDWALVVATEEHANNEGGAKWIMIGLGFLVPPAILMRDAGHSVALTAIVVFSGLAGISLGLFGLSKLVSTKERNPRAPTLDRKKKSDERLHAGARQQVAPRQALH